MCTLTVSGAFGARRVTMSRDERRDRACELAPAWKGDPPVLAPLDPESGGTWFGVRRDGAWAALLNAYPGVPSVLAEPKSRGRLVPSLLQADRTDAFWANEDLSATQPFRLFHSEGPTVREARWDGRSLTMTDHGEGELFATSSSQDEEATQAWRQHRYEAWRAGGSVVDAQGVPRLHLDRDGGPWRAVLMTRAASRTCSLVQATLITGLPVSMRFWNEHAIGSAPSAEVA